jgi:hypothetical protein
MLIYQELKRNAKRFLALTGLTVEEFEKVLPAFERTYERNYPASKTVEGNPRQRNAGGGRRSELNNNEQKLLLAVVYQKAYPLQELIGATFELSQPQINYWLHRLLPVLQDALNEIGVLPEREPSKFAQHERSKGNSSELIIDGVDRRRQRPKKAEKQKLHYSGKKKVHSDKNVVIVNAKTKRVGYLSTTYAGKVHDKMIAEQENISYPRKTTLYKDTGFQGYEPKGVKTLQPKKSPVKEN